MIRKPMVRRRMVKQFRGSAGAFVWTPAWSVYLADAPTAQAVFTVKTWAEAVDYALSLRWPPKWLKQEP